MELEATILERLEELRQWQIEQQERLLKQQQEQRELLTFEQDRMYQALGLSVQVLSSDDSAGRKETRSPEQHRAAPDDTKDSCPYEAHKDDSYRDCGPVEDSTAASEKEAPTVVENQQGIELDVPPLQLNTNRYLNFKSSAEGFSPRFDVPSCHEPLVVTVSSEITPEKRHGGASELSMEGVEPLPLDKPLNKHVAIDDLPVPSPRKDFKTMLEERLRDCETDSMGNTEGVAKTIIKRPFLKKGEGLARFKPNPGGTASNRRARPRSVSLSSGSRPSTTSSAKNNTARLKDTPKSSRVSAKMLAVPAVAQSKLSLKNVALPKKKVRSKSMSSVPMNKQTVNTSNNLKVKALVDMNGSSDFETKNRRELEEMRIFELLEEKAENSSFCSNSSTVLALFRQSTPMKTKCARKNNIDPRQRLTKESAKHESSDTSLEEIVRSTKSNRSVPDSPVTKILETVIKEDIVFSKWDSGPFSDENTNANKSPDKRGLHRNFTAGTYKTSHQTKHTTIHLNNNNNCNGKRNNNIAREPLINSNEEEDECDNYPGRKNCDKPADNDETNVSLHVRFSEYNEYKTIGLTDTSMMSNDTNSMVNCRNDKAWSDRSSSPDSSDVEILYTTNSVTTDCLSIPHQNPEPRHYVDESTDQTTDDEQSTTTDNSYDADDTISEINVNGPKEHANPASDDETEVCNDSGSTIRQENDEPAGTNQNDIESVNVNGTIFKSELLKTRLLELEREIDIFRKENAALANQRKKLLEEQRQLEREYKQKEEKFEREKKFVEESMQEEKKRLSHEKSALENRLRDAREKSLQTKQERQDIQILREQLAELKEETSQKESRWQAAQARQKSQIRVLQTENAKLKQELEKLRQSRGNNVRLRKVPASSNTRSIHRINKHLDGKAKTSPKKDSSSDEDASRARIEYPESELEVIQADQKNRAGIVDEDGSKTIVYNGAGQKSSKIEESLRQKRDMYTELLNDATQGLRGREEITLGKCTNTFNKSINKSPSARFDDNESTNSGLITRRNSDNSYRRCNEISPDNRKNVATLSENREYGNERQDKLSGSYVARTEETNEKEFKCLTDVTSSKKERADVAANKQDVREVQCPDGHVEYWYPNGNVKKVFPDRNVTKMIYYNGDVRESAEDGSVKYFYASTKTWHTTMPDGLEILEFPE